MQVKTYQSDGINDNAVGNLREQSLGARSLIFKVKLISRFFEIEMQVAKLFPYMKIDNITIVFYRPFKIFFALSFYIRG